MQIIFERTGPRHYAVEVRPIGAPVLRMDPAPGFDRWFPHDLQHLVVEEQLGLDNGIYGRLAKGGTASTFQPPRTDGRRDSRAEARQRRKLNRRNTVLATTEANDFAQSERATFIVWQEWLISSDDRYLRAKGREMATVAQSRLALMDDDERSTLVAALPRLRERIAEVTSQWSATAVGDSMAMTWSPCHRAQFG